MNILAVIPARYDSSRFPGKPLALIGGKPMIQHVYQGSRESTKISDLVVATDDQRIVEVVHRFGGKAILTGAHHQTGTSRCIEVAGHYPEAQWLINIQGDEPLIHGKLLDQMVEMIESRPQATIITMVRKITDPDAIDNANVVKCVFDEQGKALYFSRSPIPFDQTKQAPTYYQHLGIYAFKSSILSELIDLPRSPLESAESLEQLRWLEHGLPIYVGITTYTAHGVDIPTDIQTIETLMKVLK